MRSVVAWLVAVLAFAAPTPAPLLSPLQAQSRISTEVDSTRVTVGDRITMTVTVEHPLDARVTWPDSLDLAPFEVLEAQTSPPEVAGDVTRSRATFALTAFELGMLEIPSFDVVVTKADGTEEVLSTNRFGVELASVGTDESGDIRDIRGPLGMPISPLTLALWVLLPLLLTGLLYSVARRLRSRKDGSARPALGPIRRPAHVVALEGLAALEASPLLQRGQVKEFHIEASDILRIYVEARFGVDALEMTTHEVLTGLDAAGADARFRDGLRAFLEQCDLVKFAKVRPGTDASRQVLELGKRIVLDSAPAAAPAAAEPADATEAA